VVDLVTGGAGFIGSHLVRALVGEGRTVRVVDDLSSGIRARLDPVADGIEFVQADLVEVDLAPLLRGVRRVFHLAAVPSVPRSVKEPLRSHAAAATATLRLLGAARDAGADRFVLSSSSSVYGETGAAAKREDMRLDPVSPYGVAKAAAEGYARVYARLHGLHCVILRYFQVFGPGQDPASQYAAVIPIFVTRALRGDELPVFGDGEQTRDFTYVENVVAANLRAAEAECPRGSVYNVAAGSPRSLHDLIRSLDSILGRNVRIRYEPARPGDIRHSQADTTLAREELRWRPHVSFEEGLRRTVDWYRGLVS
jgi:UDP-glucose 4-epimerase